MKDALAGVVVSNPPTDEDVQEPYPRAAQLDRLLGWIGFLGAGVIFCAMAWPMCQGKVFVYGDLKDTYLPVRSLLAQALRSGDNTLWEPKIYCGTYMHGQGEMGICHPLHRLLYGLPLPVGVAFNLEFLFNYAWLFLGTFLLLQRWTLSRGVSVFGAMVFSFGGTNLLSFVHLCQLDVNRTMPWIILFTDIVMRSPSWKNVVLAQLAVSLMVASAVIGGAAHYLVSVAEGIVFGFGQSRRRAICSRHEVCVSSWASYAA